MSNSNSIYSCSHCGKPLPDGKQFCPHCGTRITTQVMIAPLPVLHSKTLSVPDKKLLTQSHGGDLAAGIALGIVVPILTYVFIIVVVMAVLALLKGTKLSDWFASPLGPFLGTFLGIVTQVIIPFFVANRLRQKYFVVGNAMMNTLLGWLIFGIFLVLGSLSLCLLGPH